MDEEKLKKLYDNASSKFSMPDFETFKADMQDDAKLSKFRDNMSNHFTLPDFDTMKSDLGLVKKKDLSGISSQENLQVPQSINPQDQLGSESVLAEPSLGLNTDALNATSSTQDLTATTAEPLGQVPQTEQPSFSLKPGEMQPHETRLERSIEEAKVVSKNVQDQIDMNPEEFKKEKTSEILDEIESRRPDLFEEKKDNVTEEDLATAGITHQKDATNMPKLKLNVPDSPSELQSNYLNKFMPSVKRRVDAVSNKLESIKKDNMVEFEQEKKDEERFQELIRENKGSIPITYWNELVKSTTNMFGAQRDASFLVVHNLMKKIDPEYAELSEGTDPLLTSDIIFGDPDKAYEDIKANGSSSEFLDLLRKKSTLHSAGLGVTGSLVPMATGGSGFFFVGMRDGYEEIKEANPDISESGAMSYGVVQGSVMMVLEEFGFTKILKGNPQLKGIIRDLSSKTIGRIGSESLEKGVKVGSERVLELTTDVVNSYMAEFQTGAAQYAGEELVKQATDLLSGEDNFENKIADVDGFLKEMMIAGNEEGLGGAIMGTVKGSYSAIIKPSNRKKAKTKIESVEKMQEDLLSEDIPKETKDLLEKQVKETAGEVVQILEKDAVEVGSLDEKAKSEMEDITSSIDEKKAILNDENVSKETKEIVSNQINELEKRSEEVSSESEKRSKEKETTTKDQEDKAIEPIVKEDSFENQPQTESVDIESEKEGTFVNVGLVRGKTKEAITLDQIKESLPDDVEIVNSSEIGVDSKLVEEPTAAIELSRELTPEEMFNLRKATDQMAIPQMSGKKGTMFGTTDWGPFNPDYFVMPEGQTLSSQGGKLVESKSTKEAEKQPESPTEIKDKKALRAEAAKKKRAEKRAKKKDDKVDKPGPKSIKKQNISDLEDISSEGKSERQVKAIKSVKNVVKAISGLDKDIEFVVHEDNGSYTKAVKSAGGSDSDGRTSGFFDNGSQIHINVSETQETTAFHEGAHKVMSSYLKRNPEATNQFYKELQKSLSTKDRKSLKKFSDQYNTTLDEVAANYDSSKDNLKDKVKENQDTVKDEFVTEALARIANGDIDLNKSTLKKVKELLIKLAKTLGLDSSVVKLTGKEDVQDFARKLSEAFNEGKVIKINDLSAIKEGASSYIAAPTEIKTQKSKREEVKVNKNGHNLSFVSESDIIDIESLMSDIADKGEKVWFWVADQLGRGMYSDTAIREDHYLDAGPSYALDPKNRKDNIIWATGKNEKEIKKLIGKSDYIFIISGSPEKSKLFNSRVFDLLSKRISSEGGYNKFKKDVLKVSKVSGINKILNKYNSLDDLAASTDRKAFMLEVLNQETKKTPLKDVLGSYNSFLDLNDLRDGFYSDNNFELNDVMLVLKPESFGGESSHSTYQHDIKGEVIGVPDKKVNAYNILPKEVRDNVEKRIAAKNEERKAEGKKTRGFSQSAKQQVVAPYGIGVKKIDPKVDITDSDLKNNGIEEGMSTSPVEKPKFQKQAKIGDDLVKDFSKISRFDMFNHVTEDSEGNYLFFHYSGTDFKGNKIDPKYFKKNSNITTDKRMHKISMFYTKPGDRESMVGSEAKVKTVKIPKNKVYPLQSDPLDFYDQAEKMFREEFESEYLAFDAHWQASYIGKVALDNGFEMLISTWDGLGKKGLRGESQIPQGFSEGVPVDAKKPIKLQKSSDEDIDEANEYINELKNSGELSDYNNGELVDYLQDIFELDSNTAQEMADKAIPPTKAQTKKRSFSERVSPEIQKGISEDGKEYIPIKNSITIEEANAILKEKSNTEAVADALDFSNGITPAARVVYASALVKRLEKDGDLSSAAKVAGGIAKYGTELGQGIQAYSVFDGLSVSGLIAIYNKELKESRSKVRAKKKKTYSGVKSGYKKGTKSAAKKTAKKISSKVVGLNLKKKDIITGKKDALARFKSLMNKDSGSGSGSIKAQVTSLPRDAESALSDFGFLLFAEGTRDYNSWKNQMKKETGYDNESDLKRLWNEGKNELGQTLESLSELSDLEKVILNHFSKKVETPLSQELEKAFDIDKTTAVSLAKEIETEFNKIAKKERKEAIKKETGINTSKTNKAIDKVLDKESASDADIDSMLDEEFSIDDLSEEDMSKLKKLGEERDIRPEGYLRSEKTVEMMAYIESKKKLKKGDLFFAMWYSSVLSGPQTQILNVFANSMNIASEQAVSAIEQAVVNKNPKAIAESILGLIQGAKKGVDEAAQTLKTGQAPSKTSSKIESPGTLETKTFKGGKFNPVNYYKYVGRVMSAMDAAAYVAVQNSMTRELASEIAKKEGLTKQAYRDRVEHLSGSKEAQESAMIQAEGEIDAIEEAEGEFSKAERNRRIRARAGEIVTNSLDPEISLTAKNFAEFTTFNYSPKGKIGVIAKKLSSIGQEIPAFKLVVPFTNIVANVLNQQLDYTPYGAIRSVRSKIKGIDPTSNDVIGSEKQRNRTMIKSVMGTALLTGLYLMVAAARDEDEENPWFDITGKGPSNYNKRNQEYARGWKPFSIKIGDTYVSYQYSPVGAGLSWLGNWADNEKYKDLDSEDMITKMAYGMSSAAQSITEMSFLTGLAGLFEFLTSDSDPERNAEKVLKSTVLIPGSFIPNLFKQVDKFMNPNLYETKDIKAAIINEIPFYKHTEGAGLKPKLNLFGENIEKTGNRFFTVSDVDPIFRDFVDKSYFAPGTSTSQEISDPSVDEFGARSKMTDDEFYKFIKESGANAKSEISRDIEYLRTLDDKEFKKEVDAIFKRERKMTKLNLEDERYTKSNKK